MRVELRKLHPHHTLSSSQYPPQYGEPELGGAEISRNCTQGTKIGGAKFLPRRNPPPPYLGYKGMQSISLFGATGAEGVGLKGRY